ncbi:MAG TPA: peptidylprolyl isomerase [Vicinamibacterales bacterium]|nr:peptidylprolyl isomerase [Vicinamibacterales bacterium]
MSIFFSVCLALATAFVPQAGTTRPTAAVQAPPFQAPAPAPAPGNPVVVVSTSLGDITLELYKERAPVSVANFLQYVADGHYADTIFHRVKPGFAIQGGGYLESLVEKDTRPPIQNEATNGLRNTRGTLAMARTRALRSATSQFYINLVNNTVLDHKGYSPEEFGYAVFGQVLSGMDVVDKIAATTTGTSGEHADVPTTPVVIRKITLKQ